MRINKIKNLFHANIQFIRYGFIGVAGLVIDFGIFYLFIKYLGIHYQIANVVAFFGSSSHNFILNAFFNFKKKDKLLVRYLKYLSIGITGVIASAIMLFLFVEIIGLIEIISKIITIFVVTIAQFILNRRFTFESSGK